MNNEIHKTTFIKIMPYLFQKPESFFALLILFFVFFAAQKLSAQTNVTDNDFNVLEQSSQVMRSAAEQTLPGVVHIETTTIQPTRTHNAVSATGRQTAQRIEEVGTGMIVLIDGKPHVITNHHVIGEANADAIQLQLYDRRKISAKRVWLNKDFDVAVIEIVENNVSPVKSGNSDTVRLADYVLVIGSPYGLNGTITRGVISSVGRRSIPKGNQPIPLHDMLQTDAAINPGNSGGPLVNMRGEVIGMISAIASSSGANEGVGFAIPINRVLRIAGELVRYGEARRPYMGVELTRAISDEERDVAGLNKLIGVKITGVTPNSPAAVAGLQIDDLIIRFNGVDVEDDNHFIRLVAQANVGDQPVLTVVRRQETLEIQPLLAMQKSR
ncbi:MAG: trypsin-like peptidase domain-containing protein [Planctomycetaceae bacterium]|nr:trypsin-like peptidase domain-containing protein [Planctomycetaceae bacterium]